jgi:hypothetical protein
VSLQIHWLDDDDDDDNVSVKDLRERFEGSTEGIEALFRISRAPSNA